LSERTAEKRTIGMVAACPFPTSQGSQVLIRHLALELSRLGHTVHVIAYPFGDLTPDPSHYTLHRIPNLIPYRKFDPGPSLRKLLLDFALLIKTVSVSRREGIEVLYGHNYEGILVAWAAGILLGIPSIHHCHSLLTEELPSYFRHRSTRRIAEAFGGLVDRITSFLPDHTIAVSQDIVNFMRSRGRKKNDISLIPPGIVPEEWKEKMADGEGGHAGRPTVVYAGNLAGFQNIPQLLEAVKRAKNEAPDLTIEVITPSGTGDLADLAGTLGIEANLSIVKTNDFGVILHLLRRADIACSMRTMQSGFPLKNLNYMAAGLPVVCYRSGAKGISDGETGIVVDDNDVDALSRAILRLLQDRRLREEMGGRAREVAFRDYNWNDLAVVFEDVQEIVIERGGRTKIVYTSENSR